MAWQLAALAAMGAGVAMVTAAATAAASGGGGGWGCCGCGLHCTKFSTSKFTRNYFSENLRFDCLGTGPWTGRHAAARRF